MMIGIDVDGSRPAVEWVTEMPRAYRLSDGERLVLLALACDSFDGTDSSPGRELLAKWCGMVSGRVGEILARLELPTEHRPALIRRESGKGGRGRRARVVLLRGLNEPARESGGLSDRNPPGYPPVKVSATPAGIGRKPAMKPAGHPGTSLPGPNPPLVAEVLERLDAAVPRSKASEALALAVAACAEQGWQSTELVEELLKGAGGKGPGWLVKVARELSTRPSPAAERARFDEYARALEQAPECEHGTPNGTFDGLGRWPDPGWRYCALCRNSRRKTA